MMALGLEPKTLVRMAVLGSRERLEEHYRDIVKTRIMNEDRRQMTLKEAVDEWRPEILEDEESTKCMRGSK